MGFFLLRRLALALATLVVAISLLFVMIHIVPGDPTAVLLGPRATPDMIAKVHAAMGTDRPLYEQLFLFFNQIAHGTLGFDVFSDRSVTDIVLGQLPYTIVLILASILWSALIGIPLGCYSAIRHNSWIDKITGVLSVGTIAVPSFVVAVYSLLFFSVYLHWLPAMGAGDSGNILSQISHLLLPAFAIGVSWVGYLARVVRASTLEVLGENHVRMARAFNLPKSKIIFRYVLRIAILPTVTLLGVGMSYLLSSAVFAEIVFSRPGIGALIVQSVNGRNYPVVMGTVLMTTILFVVSTALADIVNALLDPRVRENL